ncbi:MAG: carbamoyltransferase HypF [Desulfobaccales bacterium]
MAVSETRSGKKLKVTGVVQGVGFRPFVYRLARAHQLAGWVRNTSTCVEIEVEGASASLEQFIRQLATEAPNLARIEAVVARDAEPRGRSGFTILESRTQAATAALIPADVSTCASCFAEILDPQNRRYQYPFTNCTDCGPRFTIIRQVPYDRGHTTMSLFSMCAACRAEYKDPGDRRFHAEPTACPVCGPHLWLEQPGRKLLTRGALEAAAGLLQDGLIVAVKGLGGFHLAADARQDRAVATLRQRKGRVAKPFAVMVRDLAEAEKLCHLGEKEKAWLLSPERPVVLARKRPDSEVSRHVAPGNSYLGLMLPYTPVHLLLLSRGPEALIMTSGNLSEEPLVFNNEAARARLDGLADAFLMHNRDIEVPCDDSVVRPLSPDRAIPLRRARGFVPAPIYLPLSSPPILGVGAEQKNTFCLAWGGNAILSQHLGDLDTVETYDYFSQAISHFKALCRQDPEIVAHDLHPLYLSTRYAFGLKEATLVGVQHHHAHIAACLAENRRRERCIGIALDGTGYGPDGAIWGGEILVADLAGYSRAGHLAPVLLPGGTAAVADPRRMAAAYLYQVQKERFDHLAQELELGYPPLEWRILCRQLTSGINSPLTTSAGRLFDAVAATLNICRSRTYEGQPALELEMAADPDEDGFYPASIRMERDTLILDTLTIFRRLLDEHLNGIDAAKIAARFHNSLVRLLTAACELVRDQTGLDLVALSGGVFQNAWMLQQLSNSLEQLGFQVLTHRLAPPNDGCISLGQVAVAAARLEKENRGKYGELWKTNLS